MKRVAAYALKFIKKFFDCCSDTTKQKLELKIPFLREFTVSNQLSVQEIRLSEVTLLRDHQRGSFERKHFQKWNNLNLNINPIGLIISQGRLGHSELDDNAKFPILIAPNSDLAIQIVWDAHSKLHRSENHTISVILENFWIPQVRQLVRKLRRICVPCQRTLKAPFLYPNMGQLPSARVQRARPYENIGLDYFGPMQYRISAEEIGTAFGVIFTCSVSRLTHIEMAPDYSTRAFIQALRRFISLNGLPTSIVSDNAPAHILGEKMINESIIKETEQMSAEVIEFLAIHAIQWKFNTPYAPWQGGFFERLIRIVKEHLVRAIRTSILTYEELRTIFLEIAASMNSRPLTMPSSDNNSSPPMRPIDFVCPGRPMTLPVLDSDILDEYLPSKEAQAELTKNETIRALENSMNATEEIWRRWHKEYLVQLRAHHKSRMDNKRGTPQHPKVDQVVLLCEDMQPRNYWRLAKITELVASADNEIREVLVETVTGKNQSQKSILRRSVNQVVPLEMDGSDDEEGNAEVPLKTSNDHKETPMVNQEEPRYNLRNRRKVNYNEAEESQSMVATSNSLGIPPITTLLSLCTLFMLFGNVTGSGASQLPTHAVCTPTGLQIRGYYESFEACVKEYCTSRTRLRWSQMRTADIWIPPHLKTAPHHATVKIFDGHDLSTWELDCAAVHLCDTIDCTFCWSNILNPECHMTYAILGLGMTSFLSLFCIYALCCVPVRLLDIAVLGWSIIKLVGRGIRVLVTRAVNRIRKGTFTRQRNRWSLSMAIICLSMITSGNACQEIDFLSALQTRCTDNNGNQKCETFTDVVVNLNQVKQDGCIRITKNGTHHWDIRLRLEEVVLSCTKESITTTQDVITRVWSTKRCDSAGSCSSGKCANITRDARIPELHTVNNYTGFTGCSESCGGLGCGCFYLSSGCLFYRVYAVPRNPELYEVYRCMDYSTNAVVTMTSTRLQGWQNKDQTKDLILAIGTSVAFSEAVVTLDTLWTPPSPILNNWFITNKNRTATWVPNHVPAYTCSENGQNCSLQDTCHCNPAENAMICSCKNEDLNDWFNQVDRRLPVHQGHWRLEQQNESIVAQMKHGATASLTIRLRDQWKTVKYITEDTCTVTHSPAIGCYSCENGATAEIFCKSEKTETFASIQCDRDAFAVKCTPDGHVSNITFFSEYSRFRKSCTVECGGPQQKIEINGMLKYTASIWTTIDRLVAGNTTLYNEWNLPDIGHIFESYLTMMKTIIIMMISVFAIFFFTYSIIVSTGVKTAKGILKLILMIILFPVTALVYLYFFGRRRLAKNRHKTDHIA